MLAELWVLADKFDIPKLQNKCIENMLEIVAYCGGLIPLEPMKYIYENTSPESQLRKLGVSQCHYISPDCWVSNRKFLPYELLLDYIIFATKVGTGEARAPRRVLELKASDFFVPVKEDS